MSLNPKDSVSGLLSAIIAAAAIASTERARASRFEPCDRPNCGLCKLIRAKREAAAAQAAPEPAGAAAPAPTAQARDAAASEQRADLVLTALSDTSRSMVGLSDLEPEASQHLKAPAAALITRLEMLRDAAPKGSARWHAADTAIDKAITASRLAVHALSV